VRAVTVRDGKVVVEEHPDPAPGAGECLIRVMAAGLNGADLVQRAGRYPAPPGSPKLIPGLELAGEVLSRGRGAKRFARGDRVMGIVGGGGQAELAVVHERQLMPVPDNLAWPEAGGVAEVFTTAYDALFTQCQLTMGEHLLVHGGAGGVGTAAIQLGRLAGAKVTATVRNQSLRDEVARLGAQVIAPEDFVANGSYDVILELVDAANMKGNIDALANSGRIAVIGVGSGAKSQINFLTLMNKRGRIHGSMLRYRPLEEKAETARLVERHVLPQLGAGTIQVPVGATYPLENVADAYAHFERGGKYGKIVLTINEFGD
jgi:putative PIG3 family NAD(P)H quinone oxidoreductase